MPIPYTSVPGSQPARPRTQAAPRINYPNPAKFGRRNKPFKYVNNPYLQDMGDADTDYTDDLPENAQPLGDLGGAIGDMMKGTTPEVSPEVVGDGGSGGSSVNLTGSAPVTPFQTQLEEYLNQVLSSGGKFDENQMKLRREGIKDMLDRSRKGRVNQLKATLASRGLASLPGAPQGVEASGLRQMETDLGEIYSGGLRDIFIDEAAKASQRFMDALGLAQGHVSSLNQVAADRFRTQADAALRQAQNELAARLGLGRLDLDREMFEWNRENGTIADIIREILEAARTSAGGY